LVEKIRKLEVLERERDILFPSLRFKSHLNQNVMEKFQGKYRIPSARLPHWDYRWAGAYFITICTQNREHFFGEVVNGQMKLSYTGVIADILWHQIPHHSKNVELGAFVVMPNHIHGVVIINNPDPFYAVVETLHATSLPPTDATSLRTPNQKFSIISPKSNSVSAIIRSYKSAVTKHAHRLGFTFQWQTRFYDHIIRDERSFQTISNYIENNPVNWREDKFFKTELGT